MKFQNCIVVLALFFAGVFSCGAQVTAFTYQGRLSNGTNAANGSYDFQFRLYDAATNGTQVPIIPVAPGVLVSNGQFTTAMDFGDVFRGAPQWLEIAVQPH